MTDDRLVDIEEELSGAPDYLLREDRDHIEWLVAEVKRLREMVNVVLTDDSGDLDYVKWLIEGMGAVKHD